MPIYILYQECCRMENYGYMCMCGFSLGIDMVSLDFCKKPKPFMGIGILYHKEDNICYHYEKINKNSSEFW